MQNSFMRDVVVKIHNIEKWLRRLETLIVRPTGSGTLHDAVTVEDTATLNLTLTGQSIKGDVIGGGGVSVADIGSTAETVGGAVDNGVAATASRSDHKHAITNPKIDDLATADDNTDLNANTTNHGLMIKAVAPAAGLSTVAAIENGETIWKAKALFDTTNPADIGVTSPGTSLMAARRDHVHAGAGGGDVVGPAGATDNHLAVFDGVTGKLIKDGGAIPGGAGADGWNSDANTWTFSSSDAPTHIISVNADMTGIIGVGYRLKLTDTGTQYAIVTAVGAFGGGVTLITAYFGTDYALSGGAITSPYWSNAKAPLGFPLDPTKWTEELNDTTTRTQATPTNNTWYNMGTLSLSVPIGCWNLGYEASVGGAHGSAVAMYLRTTLSTANNSESDADFTCATVINTTLTSRFPVKRNKVLSVASKTTYYINAQSQASSIANMYLVGASTIIRAVCAYL